jgi:hypothetical protein
MYRSKSSNGYGDIIKRMKSIEPGSKIVALETTSDGRIVPIYADNVVEQLMENGKKDGSYNL